MILRKSTFACIFFLAVCFSTIKYAERDEPVAQAASLRPTPTSTDRRQNPTITQVGGVQAIAGPNVLAVPVATPTPRPKPTPTKPGTVGSIPGGVQAKVAKFDGRWIWDKALSQDPSQCMRDAYKVKWTITHDDNVISIIHEVEGLEPPASPYSCGISVGSVSGGPLPGLTIFKLDGKESTSDILFGQETGKLTLKATWLRDTLQLSHKTVFTTARGGYSDRIETTMQELSLTYDGSRLSARILIEGPYGTRNMMLVFKKE